MKEITNLKESAFTVCVGLAFLYGVLSYQHYSPSQHDFYIHSFVFLFCSIGLGIFFFKNEVIIYSHQLYWIGILGVLLTQPIFNYLIYIDGLVFPLAIIFLMFLLSLAVANLKDKQTFIKRISLFLLIAAFFLFLTQVIHILNISSLVQLMRLPLQTSRFSGSLFQPNQTAFVFVLGVISAVYFFHNKYSQIFKYFLIFLLSIGVAFTSSRTGFLMLICGVLLFNILKNKDESLSILKLKDFLFSMLGLVIGMIAYPYFSTAQTMAERIWNGLDEPRLSLLHRTGLIIEDHPLLGVGWKNFASTGIEYFESIEFFGSTDHSHFAFGQLLAEFGLFGLGIIIFFIIIAAKNVKITKLVNIYVLVILSMVLFYSMFEFPLWQLRYLLIFTIFFTLLDTSSKQLYKFKNKYFLSCVMLLFVSISLYYGYQYKQLAHKYDFVVNPNNNLQYKKEKVSELKPIFGFSLFNDILVYEIISNEGFDLNASLLISNRLVRYTPSHYYLIKHATSLAAVGNTYNSIYYFNASCHFAYGKYCKDTLEYLKSVSEHDPDNFIEVYQEVSNKYNKNLK